MAYKIKSKKHYHETMVLIYERMNKGESGLSADELQQLAEMTHAAEQYEDEVLGLVSKKKPSTIPEWVRLALFERDMTQAKLAEEIGMPRSKVSEIISGKRRPDLPFLKGLHKVLHADADFLLENA